MPNLVGIGNSQVPTNAMLGGLAYQDPDHAQLKDVEIENITAIKAKTGDTATAVFVYDTRKDSDGGAWRHKCRHTSWYNETLGTEKRGIRREFPAVAVIVALNDMLTIYDADSQDVPQPAEFDLSSPGGIAQYGGTTSTYSSAVFGSSGNPVFRKAIEGSGFLVAVRVNHDSSNSPFTLHSYQLEFTPGGRQ